MRLWLENPALRLISLGIAVVLWYVIAGEKTSEMGLSVPVELQNFPLNLELTGDPVNTVEVRLRASPGVMGRLGPGDVAAKIDLAGVLEGERIVHLTADSIRAPFGVRVVKINPAIVTLNLERTVQKTVPIRPRILGRPAPGHEVADVSADPEQVVIVGPKGRVQDVDSAFSEPVPVEGATRSFTKEVTIGIEDPVLRVQGSPRVRVTAQIREAQKTRTFEGLPVAVRGGGASVSPSRVTVRLTGPASVVEQVSKDDIRPYVEVSGLRSGTPAPVAVDLAPGHAGVSVKETHPSQVTVRLGRGEVSSSARGKDE